MKRLMSLIDCRNVHGNCVVLLYTELVERTRLFLAVWALWENENYETRVEDWDLPNYVKVQFKYV